MTTERTLTCGLVARSASAKPRQRNRTTATACGLVVAVMLAMAFAAVPFYSWFCRATGFGGTTQVARAAPGEVLTRKLAVRFDANLAGGLPWKFEPEQNSVEVQLGEVVTVLFTVTNESARDTVGQASYNVTPLTVGAYFQKINCFCFTEQRLKAGERQEMTVVFYVDPALARDSEQDDLTTITLSYTMYPVRQPRDPATDDQRRVNRDGPELPASSARSTPTSTALVAR